MGKSVSYGDTLPHTHKSVPVIFEPPCIITGKTKVYAHKIFRDKDCRILYSDKRTQQRKLGGVWGVCLRKAARYDISITAVNFHGHRDLTCVVTETDTVEIDTRNCYTLTAIQRTDQCN